MNYQEVIDILEESFITDKPILEMYYSDIHEDAIRTAVSAMQELEQYHQLGTLEEVKMAVEKQTAIRPNKMDLAGNRICPRCNEKIFALAENYCDVCGQRIK